MAQEFLGGKTMLDWYLELVDETFELYKGRRIVLATDGVPVQLAYTIL